MTDAERLAQIRNEMGQVNTTARAIIAKADEDTRELTAEEAANVDKAYEQYDALAAEEQQIEQRQQRRRKLDEIDEHLASSPGRQTAPDPMRNPHSAAADPDNSGGRSGGGSGGLSFELGGRTVRFGPDSPEAQRARRDYIQAFSDYLITGQPSNAGVSAALQTADDPRGGYLAPTQTAMELIRFLDDEVFMRQLARVLPPLTTAVSLGVPSHDVDPSDADWTPEIPAADMTADDAMRFGKRELMPHLMTKLIKVSMKLLRVAAMDPEALVRERLGYKFSVTEEKAFLLGNGAQQPLGVFTASASGIPTSRDVESATQNDYDADDLIGAFYSLKAQYQRRATWITHRDHVAKIRKFKDDQGNYIWRGIGDSGVKSQDLVAGSPGLILDRPYVMSEFAPNTISGGNYAAIVGDFKAGYWIVDALQMEIQRLAELFSRSNQIGLIGRKETDAMPVLAEAFARLSIKS